MKKVSIDLDPKAPITFEREVAIPTPSGTALKVCFAFRQRKRTEMADFFQPRLERIKEAAAAAKDEQEALARGEPWQPKDLQTLARTTLDQAVDSIFEMAVDWGIEGYDFTRENLTKFCNLYPGAEDAIFKDYRDGSIEGRLGNLQP